MTPLFAVACGGPAGQDNGSDGGQDNGSDTAGAETAGEPECDVGLVASDDGACHCGTPDGEICSEEAYCDAPTGTCVEPTCGAAGPWTPGTSAFTEVTQAWGLDGVEGTRLSVTDLDGDGWPDLFVRRGGTRSDDFGADTRHTWLLRNTGGQGFEDVTQDSGVLAPRQALGAGIGRPAEIVASADVDNDGDLDIFTGITTTDPVASLGETSELMLNQGDGSFVLANVDSDLRHASSEDIVAGASFVDANRDGFVDIWVTEHGIQDELYYGTGDGGFVKATSGSGLATSGAATLAELNSGAVHSRAWSALACDLNGDGWTELLAGSYGRSANHLWQGRLDPDTGFVAFDARGVESGYARDENYEWQSNQFARCYCQSNPMAEGCAGVPAPAINCDTPNWNHSSDREPYRLGGNSGATACADLDNDGDMDLYTGEIRHWWAGLGSDMSEALLNTGAQDVSFERPGRDAMGITVEHVTGNSWDEGHMSLTTLDFDNDGWRDIYVGGSDYAGNRGLLFHQRDVLQFEPVSTADSFEHNRSHGVVTADFDRDGDLDLIVGHSRSRCDANAPNDCYATAAIRMFENTYGDGGSWIQLKLEGVTANRAAIGARVRVTAGGVTQTQEIGGGYGHYGAQDDLVLHFGLGDACAAEIEIRWPDGDLSTQQLALPGGHRFHVVQGERARLLLL
ncbi:ASPIC/UnbV domain-containing protein [Enhygromyxa salina]|uniref:ASPIC/UnbV domain-containing protein n=1 Tax=Enhygromyxa salina TaxID=215803 RepID=A0A0C2CPM4_9BACT|nr:CRTAC1 family protein [Enhygromyxa salina]KIG11670.1 ASPIC/UnbV domain-containing protein [Enhygromyxa salina]